MSSLQPLPPGPSEMEELVRALWDYEAQDDNEISFTSGTEFTLVKRHNDDWWEGRVNGVNGLFPAAFVQIVEGAPPPPVAEPPPPPIDDGFGTDSDDEGPLKPKSVDDDDEPEPSPITPVQIPKATPARLPAPISAPIPAPISAPIPAPISVPIPAPAPAPQAAPVPEPEPSAPSPAAAVPISPASPQGAPKTAPKTFKAKDVPTFMKAEEHPEPEKPKEEAPKTFKRIAVPDFMQPKPAEEPPQAKPAPTRKLKDQDVMNRFAKPEEEAPKPKPKIEIQSEGIKAAKANVAALFGGAPAPKAAEEEAPRPKPKIEIQSEGLASAKANVAALLGGQLGGRTSSADQQEVAHTAPAAQPSAAPEMIMHPDWRSATAADGRVYYYHNITKETAWIAPMVPKAAPTPAPTPSPIPAPAAAPAPVLPKETTPAPLAHLPSGGSFPTKPQETLLPTQPFGQAPSRSTQRPPSEVPLSRPLEALPSAPQLTKPNISKETLAEKRISMIPPTQALPSLPSKPAPTTTPASLAGAPTLQPITTQPAVQQLQVPAAALAPSGGLTLPPEWGSATAPDGRVYYYNKITRETSWVPPISPTVAFEKRLSNLPTTLPSKPQSPAPGSESQVHFPLLKTPSQANLAEILSDEDPYEQERRTSHSSTGSGGGTASFNSSSTLSRTENAVVTKNGYLLKKNVSKHSSSRKWQNTFGVTYKGKLFFYKDNPQKKKQIPTGVLNLAGAEASVSEHKKRELVFIVVSPEYEYLFQAVDESDLRHWITAINEEAKTVYSNPPVDDKKKPTKKNSKSGEPESEEKSNTKSRLTKFLTSRPTADTLEKSGILVKENLLFGGRIERHWDASGHRIPRIIAECVDAVEKKGIQSIGVYRLSGNNADIQKLRFAFEKNEPLNLLTDPRWFDINAITGVLKLYFRELQEPLLTYALFESFIQSCKLENYNERLVAIKSLIQRLPAPNREILKFLIQHLSRVSQFSTTNKMETTNLAIVFGPTLMRPENENMDMVMNMGYQNSLVEHMIIQADWLF